LTRVNETALKKRAALCAYCGSCTACCPVQSVAPDFGPRAVARRALFGLSAEATEASWLCAGCHKCDMACPQDVRPSEIIRDLRALSPETGRLHPAFSKQMELLMKQGRLYLVDEFENDGREDEGLPRLAEELPDVAVLLGGGEQA